jgi:Double-GTPase 2
MLDTTHTVLPLTSKWVRYAFLIGLGLFLPLLVGAAGSYLLGVLWYVLCMLWIAIAYCVIYLIASLPFVAILGVAVASVKKGGSDSGKAGCGALMAMWAVSLVFGNTFAWGQGVTEPIRVGTLSAADGGWAWMASWAGFFFHDLFVGYWAYLLPWGVPLGALLISAGTLGLIGIARMDMGFRKVFMSVRWQCPSCKGSRPLFVCPGGCGTLHEPIASRHGIWKCQCGKCKAALGTTSITGLLKLKRVCFDCSKSLEHPELGNLPEYHFAVVGAKNSGKTNLMIAALYTLETEFAPAHKLKLSFASAAEERDYRAGVALLRSGSPQPQTPRSVRPSAFTVALKPASGGEGVLLYLYDAAGEDIQAGDAGDMGLSGHDFHRIVDGVILIVDPFAEESLRGRIAADYPNGLPAGINPAPYDANFILDRALPFWERTQQVSAQARLPFPIAVTVAKLDACRLFDRVGAYPGLSAAHSTYAAVAAETVRLSDAVRRLLAENGCGNLLAQIDSHFRTARFFGVSAFGRLAESSNRSPFQSRGTLAPLAWLLTQTGALSDSPQSVQAAGRAWKNVSRILRGTEGTRRAVTGWLCLIVVAALVMGAIWWII